MSISGTLDRMTKIAVIGGGQIGEALTGGLIASGFDGQDIVVTNRRAERREEFEETYKVKTTDNNQEAVKGADVVFVCVKPYAIVDMLAEINDSLAKNAVVVSMAAAITLDKLEGAVGPQVSVVRSMPNTPMLVRNGMNIVVPGKNVTSEQLDTVKELLSTVGKVLEVTEDKMDVAAALAGSGPAYYFLVTEALIDAGVNLGLTREQASELANSTAAGAGQLLVESEQNASSLRYGVSSPGGTTVAALRELEESGIRGAFYRAIDKCVERTRSMN